MRADSDTALEDRLNVIASEAKQSQIRLPRRPASPELLAMTMHFEQINIIQQELAQIKNNPLPDPNYYQNIDSLGECTPRPTLDSLTVTGNSNLYNAPSLIPHGRKYLYPKQRNSFPFLGN